MAKDILVLLALPDSMLKHGVIRRTAVIDTHASSDPYLSMNLLKLAVIGIHEDPGSMLKHELIRVMAKSHLGAV